MSEVQSLGKQVSALITELADVDITVLDSKASAIDTPYRQFRQQIVSAIELCRKLSICEWDDLPSVITQKIHSDLNRIKNLINQILNFKLDSTKTPEQQGTQIFSPFQPNQGEHLHRRYPLEVYIQEVAAFAGIANIQRSSQAEIRRLVTDCNALYSETEEYLSTKKSIIDSLVESATAATLNTGVDRHSQDFSSLASTHEKLSKRWLYASAVCIFISLIVSAVVFDLWDIIQKKEQVLTLTQIAPRVIIVSIVYTIAIWASKNYRNHRHLNVVNTHKQTSLQTFRTFVSAAEGDAAIKHAILIECTRTIFSHSDSGYLGSEGSIVNSSILDVAAAFSKLNSSKVT